jgi:hypothetical protein
MSRAVYAWNDLSPPRRATTSLVTSVRRWWPSITISSAISRLSSTAFRDWSFKTIDSYALLLSLETLFFGTDKEGNFWVATAEGLDRFRDFAGCTAECRLFKQPVESLKGSSTLRMPVLKGQDAPYRCYPRMRCRVPCPRKANEVSCDVRIAHLQGSRVSQVVCPCHSLSLIWLKDQRNSGC